METKHYYTFTGIGLTGVFLNVAEIFIILKGGKYRIPFHMSVLSLAVADLLTSLSVGICSALILTLQKDNPVTLMVLKAYVLVVAFSSISSQMHVILITVQRLIAVLFPFSCKRIMTSFRCSVMLALIWIISLTVTGVIDYIPYVINVLTVVSAVMIALSYALIVYRIRNRPVVPNGELATGLDLILYSGILFILFVACYFPLVCFTFINGHNNEKPHPVVIYYLFWLNMVTNPLVYFLFKVFKGNAGKCCKAHRTSGTNASSPSQ